jgi:hypothetical protein
MKKFTHCAEQGKLNVDFCAMSLSNKTSKEIRFNRRMKPDQTRPGYHRHGNNEQLGYPGCLA